MRNHQGEHVWCISTGIRTQPTLTDISHQESGDRSQRGAKYAAVLCLGAIDPSAINRDAAFRGLLEYVGRRR